MGAQCRCGTDVQFSFNHLGCIACGAAVLPRLLVRARVRQLLRGLRRDACSELPWAPEDRSFRHLLPLARLARAPALRSEGGVTMESKGKAFRRLLQDEPYLFTGGIYSPLDAQIAEQRRDEVDLSDRLLAGHAQRLARHGLPHPDRGDEDRVDGGERGRGADHRGRRRRLRQRALHHAHGAGVREDRGGGHPPRGPALPEALRPHRGQDDRVAARRRSASTGPRSRSANRLDRDFVVIARTDAFGAVGGSMEEAIWRGRAYADAGRGSRLGRAVDLGPRARHRVRARHEADAPEPAAGLQLLLVVPLAQGRQPAHLPGARRARLQASSSSRSSAPTPRCTRCGTTCRSW